MGEKVWDANRIAKLVALEQTVENIRARWPLETGPALAALVSVLDVFDPEEKKVDAGDQRALQDELDHLDIVRKNRHETAWEIERINVICATLENTDWFTRGDQNLIIGVLVDKQREWQDLKEVQDQAVHDGIMAVANRIYYAADRDARGEILQAYAEWYHAQMVQDQNLEQINRISRISREELQERAERQSQDDPLDRLQARLDAAVSEDVDDVPF